MSAMIPLNDRIDIVCKLGEYMQSDTDEWQQAIDYAISKNTWFDRNSIQMAVDNIATHFLQKDLLTDWVNKYPTPQQAQNVGIVMAGNIPLVGFHDFLCSFILGHCTKMKLSTKDEILLKHLTGKLIEWKPELADSIFCAEHLKGCDAYIATGSNNSSRYFEYYFGKYPNIIRKNRTSVAIINGNETKEVLQLLGKDIFSYYGLGCRNVTKVYFPKGYDLQVFLDGIADYADIINHHKYKNNYDYHLAIYLLNKVAYISNDFLLMIENEVPFSPVGSLHYEFYANEADLQENLQADDNIQCIVDNKHILFGNGQQPSLTDYADNVDTMAFLSNL